MAQGGDRVLHDPAMTAPRVTEPSRAVVHVTAKVGENVLGQAASAFFVEYEGQPWLITNWHVVAGRNTTTGEPLSATAATPDHLLVQLSLQDRERLEWRPCIVRLYEDERPIWFEHPIWHRRVDAVAIPLKAIDPGGQRVDYTPLPLRRPPSGPVGEASYDEPRPDDDLYADVSHAVSVLGFPFGRTGGLGYLPIWSKGWIATELDVDFDGRPSFLIDSRTRTGQSGSPVIVYNSPGGQAAMHSGHLLLGAGEKVRLLGVYSGRINEQSDLGFVWKAEALIDIVTAGVRGNGDRTDPALSDRPPALG